jgi:hypothetical protein
MFKFFKKKSIIYYIIIATLIYSNEINAFKILFKLPTRSRPAIALNLIKSLNNQLSNKIDYKILLTCDIDDHSMNNKRIKRQLEEMQNVEYVFDYSSSKIHACNRDLNSIKFDFDVLVLLSDDMVPVAPNLDIEIINEFLHKFPDFDGVINFNDGVVGDKLCTLPIIGKKFLEKLGYIYNPGYKSVFCDLELRLVAQNLNKYSYNDKILFRHDHASITRNSDELDQRNAAQKFYLRDKHFFISQMLKNFDLDTSYIYSSKYFFGNDDCNFEKSYVILGDCNNNKNIEKLIKIFNFIQTRDLYKNIELIFTNKDIEEINKFACSKVLSYLDLNDFDENNIEKALL